MKSKNHLKCFLLVIILLLGYNASAMQAQTNKEQDLLMKINILQQIIVELKHKLNIKSEQNGSWFGIVSHTTNIFNQSAHILTELYIEIEVIKAQFSSTQIFKSFRNLWNKCSETWLHCAVSWKEKYYTAPESKRPQSFLIQSLMETLKEEELRVLQTPTRRPHTA